ncbi:MAG: DNA cytosine methyltransferase [Gammaproteobacteria bacterium]|nr:DNA cytosine methyltransferase [Gammaproteobacteria bacterium]
MHLFAGIGGWPLALDLGGWQLNEPVWTFSCPCQPFSIAGQKRGIADARHLWPAVRSLIDVRRPPVCFGEQVAGAAGRGWLAGVRADLEAMGYDVCAADMPAAGVGAPHIRQRLYFAAVSRMAHPESLRLDGSQHESTGERSGEPQRRMSGRWAGEWLVCRDGFERRAQPGLFPLAHGLPRWMDRALVYSGIGNAIVPQIASVFVAAVRSIICL